MAHIESARGGVASDDGANRAVGGKRRRHAWTLALALLGLVVVAGAGYYRWRIWPWLAEPPVTEHEAARLWASVLAAASPPPGDMDGSAAGVLDALDQLRAVGTSTLDAAVEHWQSGLAPTETERSALEEAQPAVASLVRWATSDGGFGSDGPCPTSEVLDALAVARLGRVAMAVTEVVGEGTARTERHRAVLRLARAMRETRGVLHAVAGTRLALESLRAAVQADAIEPLLDQPGIAPTAADGWRALNADAQCDDARLARVMSEPGGGRLPDPSSPGGWAYRDLPWAITLDRAFFERERRMLRWWLGTRLAAAAPHQHDLAALAQALPAPDPGALPRSVVVRMMASNPGRALALIAEESRECLRLINLSRGK